MDRETTGVEGQGAGVHLRKMPPLSGRFAETWARHAGNRPQGAGVPPPPPIVGGFLRKTASCHLELRHLGGPSPATNLHLYGAAAPKLRHLGPKSAPLPRIRVPPRSGCGGGNPSAPTVADRGCTRVAKIWGHRARPWFHSGRENRDRETVRVATVEPPRSREFRARRGRDPGGFTVRRDTTAGAPGSTSSEVRVPKRGPGVPSE